MSRVQLSELESNYEGCVNLLFEIFGLSDWDKNSNSNVIKIRVSNKSKKHWWYGLKRKPKFYKYYPPEPYKS